MEESRVFQKKVTSFRPKNRVSVVKQDLPCSLFLGHTELGARLLDFFDGMCFSIFITIITIFILYSDDLRQAFFPPSSDLAFSICTLVCMGIYTTEMVALSLLKEGYFLKFYFWLDLISTLTMILDLIWINQLLSGDEIQAAASVAKIARASRASKIGAKSTKLIRIIRLIRILRLYKTASNRLNKQHEQKLAGIEQKQLKKNLGEIVKKDSIKINAIKQQISFRSIKVHDNMKEDQKSFKNIVYEGSNRKNSYFHKVAKTKYQSIEKIASQRQPIESDKNNLQDEHDGQKKQEEEGGATGAAGEMFDVPVETKVGNKLKQEIQKNIVSMILLILISIPIFNGETWFQNVSQYEKSGETLSYMKSQGNYEQYVQQFLDKSQEIQQKLIFFDVQVNGTCCQFPTDYSTFDNVPSLDDRRTDEINIQVNSNDDTFVYDKKDSIVLAAKLSIGRTTFVCFLLIVATLLFSRDVEVYALEPLENMIGTVKRISINPLQAIRDIQKENIIREAINNFEENIEKKLQTEPTVLENMIIKIGSLLAIGFGEAGTDLIARNIENHGSLNVMMPGKKSISIFGFCDIRNFTDATEILQANVMVFVNQIAQICHSVVNRVGGNPNKNIGDAFLLVWKFKDEQYTTVQNRQGIVLQLTETLRVKQIADLAVYSFVKMVAEITRSPTLQKYRNNPNLKARIPNYKGVKMGFGLHVGWTIQGPIGSEFKIDASYLSPHVNMASRLEGATKGYGIPILISGDLFNLMTVKNKQNLRKIDRVDLKSGQDPMDLYTIDISPDDLLKHYGLSEKPEISAFEKKKARVFHNQQRDNILQKIQKKRVTWALWNEDKDIKAMREPFSNLFFEQWKKGFEEYCKGNWAIAAQFFNKTLILGLNNEDGPSKNLLTFMQAHNMTPPQNWNGVRDFNG